MPSIDTTRKGTTSITRDTRGIPRLHHSYLAPVVLAALRDAAGNRVVDLGCGSGGLAGRYAEAGFGVVGVENALADLTLARRDFPDLEFVEHDLSDPLPADLRGKFDAVTAVEVIEHLYFPRAVFERAAEALGASGTLILSTPFHGYWKNLALALTNRFDRHWGVSFDHGHIKFFSRRTLAAMAVQCGFEPVAWRFIGRTTAFAKSMVLVARKE